MIGCASVRIANPFVLQKIECGFEKRMDCDVATNVNYVVGSSLSWSNSICNPEMCIISKDYCLSFQM